MRHINCNYCGQDKTTIVNQGADLLLNKNGVFTLVQCENCGLIYQTPQPSLSELDEFYPEEYISYQKDVKNENSVFKRIDRNRGLTRRCNRVIKHQQQSGHLLDVGCATGLFLDTMKERGWQVTGVEPSHYAAQYARDVFNLNVIESTLEEAKLTSNTFDLISMWDVFEHVLNPKQTLIETHRLLKPQGLLVLGLPNPASFEARLFKDTWVGWDRPRHLHLFTPKVIKNYLEETGFQLEGIESFSGRLGTTLLSIKFFMNKQGVSENRYDPILKAIYNWPIRIASLPIYWLGEALNQTTSMTVFARKK